MAIVYKVKKGDTLSKLGIPEEILKANPGLSKLSAGQVINLPSSGIPKGFQIGESGKLTSAGAGYSPGGGGIDYSVKSGGWSAGGGGIDYGPGGQNRGNDYGLNPAKGTQPGGGGMMPGQQPDPKVPQFVYSGGVIRRNTQSAINSTPGGTYINPITGIAGPGLGAGGPARGPGGSRGPGSTTLPPNYEAGGGGINYGPGYGNQQGSGLDKNGNKLQPNGLSSSTEEWIDFENPPQMTWEEYNSRLMAARAAGYTGPAIREMNGQIVKGYWNPAAGGGYQQPVQPTQQAPNTFVGGNNNTNSQMNWRF